MATLGQWIAGARPRTLVAGIAPVVVGSLAAGTGTPARFALCLSVALGLQIGVNYINDAADGARGVDRARVGPRRLVASGMASVTSVWAAGLAAITIAAAAGLVLVAIVGTELLAVGVFVMLAAIGYSAGPKPYADLGLGELFVFTTFGLVATVGTAYVQAERIVDAAWWAAVPIGLASVAIMLANNIRDLDSDAAAGKRTLPVRLGHERSVRTFRWVLASVFLTIVVGVVTRSLPGPSWLALLALPLVAGPWRVIAAPNPERARALQGCAILHAQMSLGLSLGFVFI